MSAHNDEDDMEMMDTEEVGEEIPVGEDGDMDYDENDGPGEPLEEITLQNDSVAHFEEHKDSIFCIASHPVHSGIVATGGGDDVGFIFDATPPLQPVLPLTYESNPHPVERDSLKPIYKLEGHSDSVNGITFTLPNGNYVVTAGLDGRIRAWQGDATSRQWSFVAEAQEVEEINWISPCPHLSYPDTLAIGAADGSVWVYNINAADKASPLTIMQTFYSHTGSCTAGAWTPDGKLLATVSEDSSFYVWDVFGEASASGVGQGAPSVVGLTGQDNRFRVDGGLYSISIAPNGAFAAVGGTEGQVRVVGLPFIGAASSTAAGAKGSKASGKQSAKGGASGSVSGQAGQILAALQAGSDSVETISFAQSPLTLMAVGNVDSSITLFDTAHRFAIRRSIPGAHVDDDGEQAVIKVEFSKDSGAGGWILTSCGNDGVLKRWDTRGGTAAAAKGLIGEWSGHRGGGEGGGILGFVQGGGGNWVVTAGDDSISLVFPTPVSSV